MLLEKLIVADSASECTLFPVESRWPSKRMSSENEKGGRSMVGWMRSMLVLFAMCSPVCEAVNNEGSALLVFKQGIQDPRGALSNWNDSDITPCNWRGIVCNGSTTVVTFINLARINLSGTIAPQLAELRQLRRLSLHHNNFSGGIPASFQNFTNLRALHLHNNALSGSIPTATGGLYSLRILDLSNNKLDGEIPETFSALKSLVYLNLSNNQLAGKVPGGALQRFNSSSYLGNINLCGVPGSGLPICQYSAFLAPAPSQAAPAPPGPHSSLTLLQILLMSVGLFLLFKFGIGLLLIFRWMKQDNHLEVNLGSGGKLVMFQGGTQVPSSKEMLKAIRRIRKKHIIGEGGYGVVYKVEVKGQATFAVKRLKTSLESERSFENELDTLGTVKHRNLVKLKGFCTAPQVRLLIYDYLPNGNLDQLLHGKKEGDEVIDWPIRYRIALGVARGLAYLHQGCDPRIIHGDISSTNILLDEDFEPYLSDFGLAKLVGLYDTHVTATVGGTFGYVAPEYAKTGRATDRVDVYSYGVLLLEILSGRRAVDESFTDEYTNLAGWARNLNDKGKGSEIIDKYLTDCVSDVELGLVLEVACHCISLDPEERPQMSKVLEALELLSESDTSPLCSTTARTSRDSEGFARSSSSRCSSAEEQGTQVPGFKLKGGYFIFDISI